MGQKFSIYRILNIQPGEGLAVALLMAFSFFMGLSLAFFFTATNAIFLTYFEPRMIPISFIASGVAIYLTWLVLSAIDKRLPVSKQLIVKLLFVTVSVLFIAVTQKVAESGWLAFFMYTWVRVIVYISLVTFWGIAAKVFDLRQAKRIFGLISSGEVISLILGYFSIPLLLRVMKTPDLLLLTTITLSACVGVALLINKKFKGQLNAGAADAKDKPEAAKKARKSWRYLTLIKQPYFFYISILALLPIFGYLFVDFKFLYQTKFEFNNDQHLVAEFLGIFLGFVALFEMLLKIFVSGRLMTKFGIKPSLLSLPVALLISLSLAALLGTFYGPTGIFFTFIVFARLLERAFRGAIYDPAFQILFQPVPVEQRLAFQSQIEGIPKALGTVITGVIILALTSFESLNLVHYTYIFIAVLIVWLRLTARMYKAYQKKLKSIMYAQEAQQGTAQPQSLEQNLAKCLNGQATDKLHTAYQLLNNAQPNITHMVLHNLLQQSSNAGKATLATNIAAQAYAEAQEPINQLIKLTSNGKLRKSLQEYQKNISKKLELSEKELEQLVNSTQIDQRIQAAYLLGFSGRFYAYRFLVSLLNDKNSEVKRTAIIAAGRNRRTELWPLLLDNFGREEYHSAIISAIKNIGTGIIPELDHLFTRTDQRQTKLLVVSLMQSLGAQSVPYLKKYLNELDGTLRLSVQMALSQLGASLAINQESAIKKSIENLASKAVWLSACVVDIDAPECLLHEGLTEEFADCKEGIFALLSLLYDAKTINHIRENIEKGNQQSKVYALEISDMTVSQDLKEVCLPLFEELSYQERVRRFAERFPQQTLLPLERAIDIANSHFMAVGPWTRACAIEFIGDYRLEENQTVLMSQALNQELLISETAAWILYRKDTAKFLNWAHRLRKQHKALLETLEQRVVSIDAHLEDTILNKALALKATELFKDVPYPILANLAKNAKQIALRTNDTDCLSRHRDQGLAYVLQGCVEQIVPDQEHPPAFCKGAFFGPLLGHGQTVNYKALENSLVISIHNSSFYNACAACPPILEQAFKLIGTERPNTIDF